MAILFCKTSFQFLSLLSMFSIAFIRSGLTVLLFCSLIYNSETLEAQALSFEQDVISDGDLQIQLRDFNFHSSNSDFTVEMNEDSLKWRRNELQHLNPFVKVQIKTSLVPETHVIQYQSQIYSSSKTDSNSVYTIDYNLFQPQPILILHPSTSVQIGIIKVEIQSASTRQPILVDHSCVPQNLTIKLISTIKPVYMTTRCQLDSYGRHGSETSVLIVSLQSPQLNFGTEKVPSDSIQVRLHNSQSSHVQARELSGSLHAIEVTATLPKRFHRLKTALGFGPYIYQTKDAISTKDQVITPSYMLYGKYDLTGLSSIKFFDALIATETVFNNSGVYYSYDLASALDQRLIVNALLGVQGIHYRFPGDSSIDFTTTAPQGFEIVYKHAFGFKNYNFMYGGFFSTNPSEPYINTWVRYGKGYFWELNYIKWEFEQKQISMFGLSVGIPFLQFF